MDEYEMHQVNMIAIGLYQDAGGSWVVHGPQTIPKNRALLEAFVEKAQAIREKELLVKQKARDLL
jgi:hypothetical protein